jgi:tetratricopeptide (TPR) repeat protein
LGGDFLQKQDWQRSIVCYRQARKINPRSSGACANPGTALSQKGGIKEALDAWQQALARK